MRRLIACLCHRKSNALYEQQLPIFDPEIRCKLFDRLLLPILSYAGEVWGDDEVI